LLVAVISDTHMPRGRRQLPAGCRERLAGSELIIHAGDLTSQAFLDELAALGPPVRAVYGNADDPALRETLPESLVFAVNGVTVAVLHDAGARVGREARLRTRFAGCAAVIYGHTHQPQVEYVGSMWVLNPGSPTERRRAPDPSMLWLDISASGSIHAELLRL
jgi:putative phosphoesterase